MFRNRLEHSSDYPTISAALCSVFCIVLIGDAAAAAAAVEILDLVSSCARFQYPANNLQRENLAC